MAALAAAEPQVNDDGSSVATASAEGSPLPQVFVVPAGKPTVPAALEDAHSAADACANSALQFAGGVGAGTTEPGITEAATTAPGLGAARPKNGLFCPGGAVRGGYVAPRTCLIVPGTARDGRDGVDHILLPW